MAEGEHTEPSVPEPATGLPRKCPRCGLVNPPPSQRCDCGYDLRTGTGPPLEAPGPPAERWRRVVAYLMDMALLVGVGLFLSAVTSDTNTQYTGAPSLGFLYFFYFLVGNAEGQTLGKLAMRIRAVRRDGAPPGFGPGLARTLINYLLTPLITGWPVLGKNRRAIHDYAAGTWVISTKRTGPSA